MDLEDSPWDDQPSRSHSVHSNTRVAQDENKPAADSPSSPDHSQETTTPSAPSAPTSSNSKPSRTPRRYGAQSTRLEAVDDSLGPLGPLGDNSSTASIAEEPPAPPQKEQGRTRHAVSTNASGRSSLRGATESLSLEDDGVDAAVTAGKARVPPPVQPAAQQEGPRRQTQRSVSVEQAAKPSFEITVGDPHKVGDLTSSHTVYQVRTRTTSKAYASQTFTVSRRYRDFLWLYNQLHSNNPGVVVPPPPEKQVVGRFSDDFVESRRAACERMLNKIAAHPILQHDGDLKLFLESESFNVDIKHKERKDNGLGVGESKGWLGGVGISVGAGSKFVEHDDWFHDRRIYLDALLAQLQALQKSTDTVIASRSALAASCSDFSTSLRSLSTVELSPSLSGPLDALADVQVRIKELYERQAQQDALTLGIVIDEYIRLIGSIKTAFTQRQKSYFSYQAAESELQKRKSTQEKLLRAGRSQNERLAQLGADVDDAQRRVNSARLLFEDLGRLMRKELERFEREKVEDFKSGVET
ncbi:hypothetical protein LTR28_009556, partial [Elasticomyces elasticus]